MTIIAANAAENEENAMENTNLPPVDTGALGSILSNPELMEKIKQLAGELKKDLPPESNPLEDRPASPPTNLSDGLAGILSNPAMMEKLPAILSAMSPMLNAPEKPKNDRTHTPSHDRDRLLLALKPFLSPARRDAIDTILRVAKLGEILGQIR